LRNWLFGIIGIFIILFTIYYLSTTFIFKNNLQNKIKPEDLYLQKLITKSQPLTDLKEPPQKEPYIAQDEKKEIISPEPVSITIPYYSKSSAQNIKFFQAKINGIPTEIMLDSGASVIALNANIVRQLQISQFGNSYKVSTAAGKTISYPFIARSVKLGNIEIHDIECAYVPSLTNNLLGGTFLKNFKYTIN